MHITKLSPKSQQFVSNLTTIYRDRKLTTIALAKVLCDRFPIPPAKVDSIEGYFKSTYGVEAIHLIGFINEITIVKQDEVMDLLLRFYKIRCLNAYPCENVVLRTDCGVNDLVGVSRALDEETICMINKDAVKLTGLIQGMSCLVEDIAKDVVPARS